MLADFLECFLKTAEPLPEEPTPVTRRVLGMPREVALMVFVGLAFAVVWVGGKLVFGG